LKSKEKTLIRDLARLFTNYSVRDWEPIVRLLKAGESKINEITTAIEQSEKPKARTRKKHFEKKRLVAHRRSSAKTDQRVVKPKETKQAPKAQAKDKNRKSSRAAKRKRAIIMDLEASPTNELRNLYATATGTKPTLPSRDAIVHQLSDYLLEIPRASRSALLRSLRGINEDPTENYRRWTRLISRSERKR